MREMRKLNSILGIVAMFLVFDQFTSSSVAQPSFDCTAANREDEMAICADDHLSELDLLVAKGFAFLKNHSVPSDSRIISKAILALRTRCSGEKTCIELAQLRGIDTYNYLGANLALPSWANDLSSRLKGSGISKVMIGRHTGDATIQSYEGIDSANAIALVQMDVDDNAESCTRNLGIGIGYEPNEPNWEQKVAACVATGLSEDIAKHKIEVDCIANRIEIRDGGRRLIRLDREEESLIDGRPYRPVQTVWEGDELAADSIDIMLETLRVLCPSKYQQLFFDLEPH